MVDLEEGTYFITIQDSNGCDYEYQDLYGIIQQTYMIDIVEPNHIVFSYEAYDVTCFGEATHSKSISLLFLCVSFY